MSTIPDTWILSGMTNLVCSHPENTANCPGCDPECADPIEPVEGEWWQE